MLPNHDILQNIPQFSQPLLFHFVSAFAVLIYFLVPMDMWPKSSNFSWGKIFLPLNFSATIIYNLGSCLEGISCPSQTAILSVSRKFSICLCSSYPKVINPPSPMASVGQKDQGGRDRWTFLAWEWPGWAVKYLPHDSWFWSQPKARWEWKYSFAFLLAN